MGTMWQMWTIASTMALFSHVTTTETREREGADGAKHNTHHDNSWCWRAELIDKGVQKTDTVCHSNGAELPASIGSMTLDNWIAYLTSKEKQ